MAKSKKVNEFKVLENRSYETLSRGTLLTLSLDEDGWVVQGSNACSSAYRTLGSYRRFGNLQAVENAYKGWVGIIEFDAQKQTEILLNEITKKSKI